MDWTIVAGAAIAVVGWIVVHILALRHEVFKLRVSKRIAMFDSLFPALASVADLARRGAPANEWSDAVRQLSEARLHLQLYGYRSELEAFEAMIVAFDRREITEFVEFYQRLVALAKTNLRRELSFKTP